MKRLIAPSLVCLALVAPLSTTSVAQTTPQVVNITKTVPRTDVRTLCPDIDNELADVLTKVARERAEHAMIDVRFVLDGSRISDVSTGTGLRAYRSAIRWAVSGLQCTSPEAGQQSVAMRIQFLDPTGAPGQNAVALVGGGLR